MLAGTVIDQEGLLFRRRTIDQIGSPCCDDVVRAVISVIRPFHAALLANSLRSSGVSVSIYTSALRRYFRGLSEEVDLHLTPAPFAIVERFTSLRLPRHIGDNIDIISFDIGMATRVRTTDLFIGWAGQCLYSARKAKRQGAFFTLDRACPHCDFQQALVKRESFRTGVTYHAQPDWARQRQLDEYEMADAILVPSQYTADSFPPHLQTKLIKAPLFGRCAIPDSVRLGRNPTFTVGVVGGSPLRKGYLYLLKAWKQLALPNARLLLRTGRNFGEYPVLNELVKGLPNVEFLDYVPNISDFYQQCDVFVLPSIDDGFGMALVEAMVNGRPCIATTNCGASELMTDGHDGLVVRAADEMELAAALLRLYESEDLRQSIAMAGRSRAQRILSLGLYDQAITGLLGLVEHKRLVPAQVAS
jgi:glycosyltransferase involved in cell wall biosynthesis